MDTPSYDLIVFGATGFVGKLITSYLLEYAEKKDQIQWAVAGRSEKKLNQLKTDLGAGAIDLPIFVVDARDEGQLAEMCRQTRVVISTVGPYALYGEPLVKACAEAGTDYCDLTGEIQWIYRMLGRYEATAQKTGARIVNCCGFDSIPSDMGVYFLQQQALERYGKICTHVKMRVARMKGSFSGGTVASMINTIKESQTDPAMLKVLLDSYSLCPAAYPSRPVQKSVLSAQEDPEFSSWAGPFIMAVINEHIVHRSHAVNVLANPAYQRKALYYNEATLTGSERKGRRRAGMLSFGTQIFTGALNIKPFRWMMERFFLPSPGQGPSPEAQRKGFYQILFWGQTEEGQTLRIKLTGDRDPGYGSTSKMLGQAGICLARDISKEEKPGGFWTPSTVFSHKLIDRLQANAGMTFEVIDSFF